MEIKNRSSVANVAIWVIISSFLPIIMGNLSFLHICLTLLFFATSWVVGIFIIKKMSVSLLELNFISDGISILIGSFFLGLLLFIPLNVIIIKIFIVTLFVALSYFLLKKQQFVFLNINYSVLISIGLSIFVSVFLFSKVDVIRAMSQHPVHFENELWDPVFFTTIVSSLRHGFVATSWNELGSPINYQIGSFLTPSIFSAFTGVSSHISLWGVWMPFYKVLSLLLVAEVVIKFLNITHERWWVRPLIIVLSFSLAPIHPLYVLKLEPTNFVFLGSGWILPGGNPPFTGIFPWILILMFIFTHYFKTSIIIRERAFFIFMLASMVIFKVPMFFSIASLFGFIGLYILIIKKEKRIVIDLFLTLILSIVFYKLNYQNDSTKFDLSFGYQFLSNAKLINSNSLVLGIFVTLVLYFVWGGIRFGGILFLLFNKYITNKSIKIWAVAGFLVLIFSTVLPNILSLKKYNNGVLLEDVTFNLLQFVRASFYLITIFGVIGVVAFLFSNNINKKIKIVGYVFVLTWSILVISSTLTKEYTKKHIANNNSWYNEVIEEIKHSNTKLPTSVPSNNYSSQMLVAYDICPFWVTCKRREGGYNMTVVNSWRWVIMDDCISGDSLKQIKAYKSLLKNNVDAIVCNPDNIKKFHLFAKVNNLTFKNNTWVLQLK